MATPRNQKPDHSPPDPAKNAAQPSKWWQWFLVYPTLAVSLIGAIPTATQFVESIVFKVPFDKVDEAKRQNELWQRNMSCVQHVVLSPVKTKYDVEIASAVCETGDVLLSGKRAGADAPQLRWVSWGDVAPPTKESIHLGSLIGISNANATNLSGVQLAQGWGGQVMCQRWVGNGMLLQRIGTPGGCFDQVINTYSGWIVSRNPAPCAPTC